MPQPRDTDPVAVDSDLAAITLRHTGADALEQVETVQTLWSGYGRILRCHLRGAPTRSVIVKHVRWPNDRDHPRGWNSEGSHQRKVKSYEVETHWYEHHARSCGPRCRVPRCLGVHSQGDEVYIFLEDLDQAGFGIRSQCATRIQIEACLRWLAHFHATFMGRRPEGLWTVGTYWHLATRPEEFAALEEGELKQAATRIDRTLSTTAFQTFVHGDAKLANFCFCAGDDQVAAVDFQYVGGGCGIKDVAYFISSCLDEEQSEHQEQRLLDLYFEELEEALQTLQCAVDFAALHRDWRALYPVAWTDFYRFLLGWSPGHWKIHRYSERLARQVLGAL